MNRLLAHVLTYLIFAAGLAGLYASFGVAALSDQQSVKSLGMAGFCLALALLYLGLMLHDRLMEESGAWIKSKLLRRYGVFVVVFLICLAEWGILEQASEHSGAPFWHPFRPLFL